MKGVILVVSALLVAVGSVGCATHSCGEGKDFVSIFNGKDLSGWDSTKGKKAWFAKDGMIVCDPKRGEDDAYLYTLKKYADFVLSVEFKVEGNDANSGIFFRVNDPANAPAAGFEIQVLGDYGREPGIHSSGAIYGVMAPPKNYSRPLGEWNHYLIIVKGRQITTFMNGNELYSIDMDDPAINETVANSPRKDLVPKDRRQTNGHIALQNHGAWVAYRNIEIKALD